MEAEPLGMFLDNASVLDVDRGIINNVYIQQHFDAFSVTIAVLYLAVCIVGLSGNSLVIIAILKLDKMSSATTVYIFNLALADGLFMVGLPFIAIQNFQDQWVFGGAVCKLVMILDGINQFTSVFCLTVMSVDRYMALVDPLRFARWRTPKRAKIIATLMWFISLFPVLPMAIHFSADYGLCTVDPHVASDSWWLAFLSYTFVLGFALPFTIMIVFYTALVVTLRNARQTSASLENHHLEKQVTKMVVAVVLVFGVCWLPFYVFNFCSLHQMDLVLDFTRGFEFVVLLSYSWSCANPILYACLSETFRRHFRALLCPHKSSPTPCERDTEGYVLHDTNTPGVSVLA
ncbi:somatostatin receptor type 2 [Danio rerio]|uniref:Somatostatin receptor type 2 n=2 Tax=Danio rerio TaxID=7955 RepID=A0A455LLX8_DANRE|nr:somatostatin receptor type 2-like [Danio rerio]AYP25868.1 somatostatin receptor type 7 [Danio rerio]|eukprot:XP_002665650.1 somatostatin receptor type 2-like [Danio rerio]